MVIVKLSFLGFRFKTNLVGYVKQKGENMLESKKCIKWCTHFHQNNFTILCIFGIPVTGNEIGQKNQPFIN